MSAGSETQMHRDLTRIADFLEQIARTLSAIEDSASEQLAAARDTARRLEDIDLNIASIERAVTHRLI